MPRLELMLMLTSVSLALTSNLKFIPIFAQYKKGETRSMPKLLDVIK